MQRTEAVVDTILLSTGTGYALTNIHTILGIVILAIQICWFVFKTVYFIYRKLKQGKTIQDCEEDVNSLIGNLTNMEKYINDREDKKR